MKVPGIKERGGRAEMAPILSDVPAGTGIVTFFKLILPRMLTSDVSAFME